MLDIRPALRGFLLADAGVSEAVGAARIYPVKLPQGEVKTSIVYNRISGQGDHTLQFRTNLARTRFQIDCWAQSHDAANNLANLVKDHLDGWRGPMEFGSNSPKDSVTVQGVFYTDERDLWDEESKLYSVSRDYFIWVEEH